MRVDRQRTARFRRMTCPNVSLQISHRTSPLDCTSNEHGFQTHVKPHISYTTPTARGNVQPNQRMTSSDVRGVI